MHSGVIKVKGDIATARQIVHEVAQGHREKYYSNYGVFNDKMEKMGGDRVFTSRSYDCMWLDNTKFPGQAAKLTAYI